MAPRTATDWNRDFPTLVEEWNDPRPITDFSRGSKKTAHWRCAKGHEWDAMIKIRTLGAKCPYCSGRKVVAGENDLATLHPEIAAEWNDPRDMNEFTLGSKRSIRWRCKMGHEWEAKMYSRTLNGTGCPYCSGRRTVPGITDLLTTHPELALEWADDRPITDFSRGSEGKIKWRCLKGGHEWTANVYSRTADGYGCPFCAGKRPVPGVTDLATKHPELITEWNDTRPMSDFMPSSGKKVAWKCAKGHEWEAVISSRTKNGNGCPVCRNYVVLAGFNDLSTTHPDIIKEWNDSRTPSSFTYGSDAVIDWKCQKGHTWQAAIYSRTTVGSGCPRCANHVSHGEISLREFVISTLGGDKALVEASNRQILGGLELDVYIPNLKLAIEYNGVLYHSEKFKSRDYHVKKLTACENAGVRLIQIWEDDWRLRRSVVEGMLRTRLGVSTDDRVNARNLTYKTVTCTQASIMLNENHIQGESRGTFYDGLVDSNGELRAVLVTLRTGDREYVIERYCSNALVRGGFGKLLKVLERRASAEGGGKITTFADREISDGDLYLSTGFVADKVLRPDYKYLNPKTNAREHKFNYRKKRFRDDPVLKYDADLTERELAAANGLLRCWDSGKIRFVKTVN